MASYCRSLSLYYASSNSDSSLCPDASWRPSTSSSTTSFCGGTSASTSMSSMESSAGPAQRCTCELVDESYLNNLYSEHAESTDGAWYGPLPVAEWKERFLPSGGQSSSKIDYTTISKIPDAPSVADCIIDSAICTTVYPRATHNVHGEDHTTGTFLSPDISILAKKLDIDHDSRRLRDELLGATLAFGEIVSEEYDPFPFVSGKPDSKKAASTRGRLVAMMRAVAVNSFRTFCYAFVVMPKFAYLIRFDHSGMTFTESFQWRTSGDLADFLARFDGMTDGERGWDTSVTTIPSASQEARQAKGILAKSDALPEGVLKTSVIPKNYRGPLSLMQVYDDEQNTFHRVVVHRPMKAVEHYLGRCTRGFYGVDLDEGAVVYVKDAWRVDSSNAVPEAATYRRLSMHGVPHLAGFYHGGDVPTDTPALLLRASTSSSAVLKQETVPHDGVDVTAYTHHRLLCKNIGRHLKTFHSTHQLCTALLHALEAHSAAYEDARILHRDVSGGNILIDKEGRGMLIDWDMCVWRENVEEMNKIGQPVGTWPFISAELLMTEHLRPHLLRDDLESFVHVLYYYALRYRPVFPGHDGRMILQRKLDEVFRGDRWRDGNGRVVGGFGKAQYLSSDGIFNRSKLWADLRPRPLCALMEDVRDLFGAVYAQKPLIALFDPEDDGYADVLEDLERYEKSFATASAQLESSQHMISLFRHWTQACPQAGYTWLPSDGADDQLVPRSSTSASGSPNSRKRASGARDPTVTHSKTPRIGLSNGLSAGASARALASRSP